MPVFSFLADNFPQRVRPQFSRAEKAAWAIIIIYAVRYKNKAVCQTFLNAHFALRSGGRFCQPKPFLVLPH